MNILSVLESHFPPQGNYLKFKENYSSFSVEYRVSVSSIRIQESFLSEISHYLGIKDSFYIDIIIGNDDPITLSGSSDINEFRDELYLSISSIEDEIVQLKLRIDKDINEGIVSIYDFNLFDKFIAELNPFSFLRIISSTLNDNGILRFKLLDDYDFSLTSRRIVIVDEEKSFSDSLIDLNINTQNIFFSHMTEYPYSPMDFYPTSVSEEGKSIVSLLKKLTIIFSLIYICNYSNLYNDKIQYKINGFRSVEEEVDLDNIRTEFYQDIFNIYEWSYLDHNNLSEKLGITRNIISIFHSGSLIDLDTNILPSIKSGYQTYLQSNLDRYIDTRNKINEQLIEMISKSNSVIDKYLESYQKSIFSFVSFFITVFILRVLISGDFNDVFTRDATIIFFALLGISILFFIFSFLNLQGEKKRFISRYDNLKYRFRDLLISEDIDKILRNDHEFNSELNFFYSRQIAYTTLWILTIFVFIIMILSASSYLNWNNIFDKISSLWT